jgi:hypothetical protein
MTILLFFLNYQGYNSLRFHRKQWGGSLFLEKGWNYRTTHDGGFAAGLFKRH